jgi:hypothetical protein
MHEPTQEQIDQINEALFAGRKIEAIKIYRTATRADLREAKDFVEAVEARLRSEMPERFVPRQVNLSVVGCAFMILALALAVAVVIVFTG